MSVTIYHNPRCSKSRQTLQILEDKGIKTTIVEYLKSAPTATELKNILGLLGLEARQLLRKNESAYKEAGLDDPSLSESQIIAAMVEYPILIERPIVVANGQARIGRPPESVEEIL